MRARFGPTVANVATAHKLARIFYAVLKTRQPYHDIGAEAYEAQHQARLLAKLKRLARQLGMELVPSPDSNSHDEIPAYAT